MRYNIAVTYSCVLCHTEFEAKASAKRKYCSRQCYYQSEVVPRIQLTCLHCGEHFERRPCHVRQNHRRQELHYCSQRCCSYATKVGKTFAVTYRPAAIRGYKTTMEWKRLRRQICVRDNYQCQMCSKQLAPRAHNMHVDHKIPVRLGGADIAENLWCLCSSCHRKKDARLYRSGRMF